MEAKEEAKEEASYLVFFSLSLRQTLLLFIFLQCTRRNMFSFRASIESRYKSLFVSNSLPPPPTPLHALPFETYTRKTHKRYMRERDRGERERVRASVCNINFSYKHHFLLSGIWRIAASALGPSQVSAATCLSLCVDTLGRGAAGDTRSISTI